MNKVLNWLRKLDLMVSKSKVLMDILLISFLEPLPTKGQTVMVVVFKTELNIA
jgi:hypothetical protein